MLPGADAELGGAASLVAIELLFLLLIVVTALAILARRIGLPYPILLVIGGLLLGLVPGLPRIELEPDLVFLIFLPPIIGRPTSNRTSPRARRSRN